MRRRRRARLVATLCPLAAFLALPSAAASAAPPDPEPTVTVPEPEDPAQPEADAAPEAPPEGVTVPPTVPPDPVTGPVAGPPPPAAAPPVDLRRVRALVARQLRAARAELGRLEAALVATEAREAMAEGTRATLQEGMAGAKVETGKAVRRLRGARLDMRERATAAFIRGSLSDLASVLESKDPNEFLRRTEFMGHALQADHDAIDDYRDAKGRVDGRVTRLAEEIAAATAARDAASGEAVVLRADLELARRRVLLHQAGSAISVAGFVFPVGDPHAFVDSFLAPRMTGTGFAHRHQGTDIMAASGTPLLACERGVIVKVGTDRLGGTKLWLVGESGTRYYYAHLSAFAKGVVDGVAVPAGQVIGYVGTTGNASGGPAHLHFEVHPPGLDAVNPFPLLFVTDTSD